MNIKALSGAVPSVDQTQAEKIEVSGTGNMAVGVRFS
jgi:hypothetical protein